MKKLSICLIAFIFIGIHSMANPAQLIKKAGHSKDYPNSDYLIVLDETSVDVQESGLSYNKIHKILKVLFNSPYC